MIIDAKAYLKQVKLYDVRINTKQEELERLKAFRLKITPTLKDDVVSGGCSYDKLADITAKILDLESQINKNIDSYVDKRNEVVAVLNRVKNEKQYQVLYKRYVLFKTWEQIACDIGYSYQGVCKLHGRALQTVTYLLNNHDS